MMNERRVTPADARHLASRLRGAGIPAVAICNEQRRWQVVYFTRESEDHDT